MSFNLFFPPAYRRRIWNLSRVNVSAIREAVKSVDWNRAFKGLNIDERVKFLTACVLNAFYNFSQTKSSHSGVKIMLWITPEIKRMILENSKIYRRYVKHGRSIADCQTLREITSRCKSRIKETKSNYFSSLGECLNYPAITPKKY